jgi:hypothetical protein
MRHSRQCARQRAQPTGPQVRHRAHWTTRCRERPPSQRRRFLINPDRAPASGRGDAITLAAAGSSRGHAALRRSTSGIAAVAGERAVGFVELKMRLSKMRFCRSLTRQTDAADDEDAP